MSEEEKLEIDETTSDTGDDVTGDTDTTGADTDTAPAEPENDMPSPEAEKTVYGDGSEGERERAEPETESGDETGTEPEAEREKNVHGSGEQEEGREKNVHGAEQSEERVGELHDEVNDDENEWAYENAQQYFGDLLPRPNIPKSSTAEDFAIDLFVELVADWPNNCVAILRANAYKERVEKLRSRENGIRENLAKGIKTQISALEANNQELFIKTGADMLAKMESFSAEEKRTFKKGMQSIAYNLQEMETLNRNDPRYLSLQKSNNEWMKYLEQRTAGKSAVEVSKRSQKEALDFMQQTFNANKQNNRA